MRVIREAIKFDRVTMVYQNRQIALADVSFQLPAGSTVGLLGANGSGKSTLIRLALGLITPSAGGIQVFDRPMSPAAKALRQRMGFLSDDPAFPRDLTAIGYLQFVGACFNLERRERQARVGTLLRSVGLIDDAGRKIGTFSTGMKTRLGIAASLMNDPELVIWDEPTTGLDPISRSQTLALLERFRGEKTVLLSSHILGDIDRVCDRLLILNQGQLLFDGTAGQLEEVLPRSVLELRFSGDGSCFRAAVKERLGRPDLAHDPARLRIELGPDDVAGQIVEQVLHVAKETGTTIDAINSTAGRLEDAYLKLITEDEFRGFIGASKR